MQAVVISRFPGTVRIATEDDLPAIARLLATSDLYGADADEIADNLLHDGYAFVLDGAAGDLVAVAHLRLDHPRGQLDLCVVAPGPGQTDLEARMIGIAAALCTAFSLDALDVVGRA